MLRNNYTKMFIRVYVHGSRYKVRRRAISLACTRNIGLREKMRRIFSVYNNEANAPPPPPHPLSSPPLPPSVYARYIPAGYSSK